MKLTPTRIASGLNQRWTHYKGNRHWQNLINEVLQAAPLTNQRPVVFFNASTRLQAMSQNAAYSLLTALAVRLAGVPVIQFICNSGLQRCVLGSKRDNFDQLPPCERCTGQSRAIFKDLNTRWFEQRSYPELEQQVTNLPISRMENFEYQGIPLGIWALNSLRWMLRRLTIEDTPLNRAFFRAYILSAWNVYSQFSSLIQKENPQAVVLFNGMFYPEAAARYACLQNHIRVITHEVGLRPYTAFFTTGEATAYPMEIDAEFELDEVMNQRLDEYLSARFKGNFSMAGIRFWPEIKPLDPDFIRKAARFDRIVPVFTNVIFDTSQVHANTLFPHMFAWLENVLAVATSHPNVLFVLRAHPDECRPGKESRESVADWVKKSGILNLPNVMFYDANEFVNSYELIHRSHLVMVYNSTIGLEATLLGKPVLAGGKARFTQLETSFYPSSAEEYNQVLEKFLTTESIEIPPQFQHNARRFLYYQLYATSLEFGDFVEDDRVWKGYVKLKDFPLDLLRPERSRTVRSLLDGILHEGDFTNLT